MFAWPFHSHNMQPFALLGLFTDQNWNDRFPYPFYILQLVKSLAFPNTWDLKKATLSVGTSLYVQAIIGSTSPPDTLN